MGHVVGVCSSTLSGEGIVRGWGLVRLKGTGSRVRGKDVVGEGKGDVIGEDRCGSSFRGGGVPVCVLEGGLGCLLLASCSAILSMCASKSL